MGLWSPGTAEHLPVNQFLVLLGLHAWPLLSLLNPFHLNPWAFLALCLLYSPWSHWWGNDQATAWTLALSGVNPNTMSEYSGIMTFLPQRDVLVDVTLHPLDFLCCGNTQLANTELVVHQGPPGPFSTELAPLSWVDPSLCCCPSLCFPRCKTLYLS